MFTILIAERARSGLAHAGYELIGSWEHSQLFAWLLWGKHCRDCSTASYICRNYNYLCLDGNIYKKAIFDWSDGVAARQIAGGRSHWRIRQGNRETAQNLTSIRMWSQTIGKYPPTFLDESEKTLNMSHTIAGEWLFGNMLRTDPAKAKRIAIWHDTYKDSEMQDRHISIRTARE